MKKIILILSFFIVLQSKTDAQYGGGNYITFQTFYDQLSPYGIWVYYPQYGGYAWAPDAGRYFKPYGSNGRWVYTQYGWTWASYYNWGWAPFHYGRWIYDDWRGWLWLPGYDWAPAWVAWGAYGGNYGWAPLGPNININADFGWRPPSQNWWTFVPRNHFGSSNWQNYTVRNNTTIVNNNITIINNVYQGKDGSNRNASRWLRGPEVRQVERDTRTSIRPMEISNTNSPDADRINNNRLSVYRPSVNKRPEAKPGRTETFDRLRPVSKLPEREPANQVRPVNPRPAQPVTRPVKPSPSPRPTQPVTRPANPAPAPRPTQPVTRPVNPTPSPRSAQPSARPANPSPASQPAARPAAGRESNPAPRPAPRRVE